MDAVKSLSNDLVKEKFHDIEKVQQRYPYTTVLMQQLQATITIHFWSFNFL